jgi:hypothetical protein
MFSGLHEMWTRGSKLMLPDVLDKKLIIRFSSMQKIRLCETEFALTVCPVPGSIQIQ